MSQYSKDLDFEGLKLVFRRSGALPQLPGSAVRLLEAIDSGEASARDLERIITCDASLTANLLRLANSADSGLPSGITTIRAAILRLGQRSVRSMGVSLTIQSMLGGEAANGPFDPLRYARHTVAVGFLCRYIFARRKQMGEFQTRWSTEEFFSAGLMHDLGHALLSRVVPGVYAMVCNAAEQGGKGVAQTFQDLYGNSLGVLGAEAARTWGLPKAFLPAIEFADRPTECDEDLMALYCLHYADHLATQMQLTIEPWSFTVELDPLAAADVALDEGEVGSVLEIVRAQTESYLQTSGCMAA